jgi:ribokinase
MSSVVVVGSVNCDHRLVVADFPAPGQTIMSIESSLGPGGKGANQAVAVARAGAKTTMVACVGDDIAGRDLLAVLKQAGVDTSRIRVQPNTPTGAAYVMVNKAGENCIIVAPGANETLTAQIADPALDRLQPGDFVMLQLEIPFYLVESAIFKAHAKQATVVMNVSPVDERVRPCLGLIDVLVVNETELLAVAAILGVVGADTAETAKAVAAKLDNLVVCTTGAEGAMAATNKEFWQVAAPAVTAVDTTGAGDTFTGYLVAELAKGTPMQQALGRATAAASLSVTKAGAIPAIPMAAEVKG